MSEGTEWIGDIETGELERRVEEMHDELEYRRDSMLESPDEADTGEPTRPTHVYVLSLVELDAPDKDLGLVKVGVATDHMRRIGNLQTGNPHRLRLEGSVEALPSVAYHVENWVHRTRAESVVQLEWLRLDRREIPGLVEEIKRESERFAAIANAKARWSQCQSNRRPRPAGDEERRLHEGARDIYSRLCPVTLQLERARARIALLAGPVRRVPGVVEVRILPERPRFKRGLVLEKFRDLAADYMAEGIQGRFRWRDVPTEGSADWGDLRSEAERLEAQVRDLDKTVLAGGLQDEGARTDDLEQLHAEVLKLTQEEKRLKVDEKDIRAQMIQCLENFEEIPGVCSYGRALKPTLDSQSFRKAHEREADQCCIQLQAAVRRRIYQCRSY